MDEPSLLRLDPNEKLYDPNSLLFNSFQTSPKTIIEIPTKSYVDSLHESNRNRRDLSLVFNDQGNDFDNNNLTNLDSTTVIRDASLDNEIANKKYSDDESDKNTVLRFNQTLQNYLNVYVGNDTYSQTKYDRTQITDTTIIYGYLLEKWLIECNDKNNSGKTQNFTKSTKTISPTGFSGATKLPPIGKSFMYIETSSNDQGNNVFVSFERPVVIQINNITFYYKRFSILTNDSLKLICMFRIQLLLEDNTWSTRYNLPKNDRYSDLSTDWTKLS